MEGIEDALKKSFLPKFKIVFAPSFQAQFESVLALIRKEHPSFSEEEVMFHYSGIEHYLIRQVVREPDESKRCCTKDQLLKQISNSRRAVFTGAFEEYQGAEAYFKFVKSKFEKPRKNRHNLIIIGPVAEHEALSVADVVDRMTEQYYVKAMANIKPPIFVVDDRYLEAVKKELIQREVLFNDGYESISFSPAILGADPIINKVAVGKNRSGESLAKISFKLRLIGMTNLSQMSAASIVPNMIYSFDAEVPHEIADIPHLKIDRLNTQQLLALFT